MANKKKNPYQEAADLARKISEYTDDGIIVFNGFLEDYGLKIVKA